MIDWIDTKERLPEDAYDEELGEYTKYLLYFEVPKLRSFVSIGFFVESIQSFGGDGFRGFQPTHWAYINYPEAKQ